MTESQQKTIQEYEKVKALRKKPVNLFSKFDKYEAEKYIESLKETKMKELKADNVYLKESF